MRAWEHRRPRPRDNRMKEGTEEEGRPGRGGARKRNGGGQGEGEEQERRREAGGVAEKMASV